MATWPITLPRTLATGYDLNPVDPSIRTDMEVGAARTRRRTSARNDKVGVNWIFSDSEMAIFRDWFDDPAQCAGGSAWFATKLALGTGGVVAVEARFVGIWKSVVIPPLMWSVTATLEVR